MSATETKERHHDSSGPGDAVDTTVSNWVDGYAPDTERPLAGYASLVGGYATGAAAFALSLRASNKRLPERIPAADSCSLPSAPTRSAGSWRKTE